MRFEKKQSILAFNNVSSRRSHSSPKGERVDDELVVVAAPAEVQSNDEKLSRLVTGQSQRVCVRDRYRKLGAGEEATQERLELPRIIRQSN